MIPDEFLVERHLTSSEICKAVVRVFGVRPEEVQVVQDELGQDYDLPLRIPVVKHDLSKGDFHSYLEFMYGISPHPLLLSQDPNVFNRIVRGMAKEFGCRILFFPDACPEGEGDIVDPSGTIIRVIVDESIDDDGPTYIVS